MATTAGFKQQCPSCEAMVPIRDPNLIGRKIDCPKCKYRFVVEEPGTSEDEEAEAAQPAGKASRGVADKRRANGKGAPVKAKGGARQDEQARVPENCLRLDDGAVPVEASNQPCEKESEGRRGSRPRSMGREGDRSKDDAKCGVETHINDGVDIALGSRMREEHHDEEPPWRLADVSAERVEDDEKEKPYRGGK